MDAQNCTYVMHGNDLWVVCRHLSPTHSMHGSQTNASSSFQSCTSKPCTYVRIWTIPPWALFAHETVTHINIRACNFLSCAPRSVFALNGRTVTKLQFLLAPTVQGREHGIKIMALLCAHHWKWTRHHMWPWELQQGPPAKFVTHNVDWSTMWWWHTMNAWSLDTH